MLKKYGETTVSVAPFREHSTCFQLETELSHMHFKLHTQITFLLETFSMWSIARGHSSSMTTYVVA